MEKTVPLKRKKELQGISRDHHQGLLLCWKIRTGFSKGIEVARIKRYADWFFKTHLVPHFELEERYMFPILGKDNELVKKALAEHSKLIRLFEDPEIHKSIKRIEEELEKHIRFEERLLFNEIQKIATTAQLSAVSKLHNDEKFRDNSDDPFWA
ncbi:hemerythrin domain-containing protein [uncultured Kriegella sp.]|uniref:hemerythrin domain-containing protein n=1 Tax=uncultured Kriegella sp. TaxID=1798910 RepID=UPI0030DDAB2D|tara:strand:+ start:26713 stop:27174 length:462 start_codon:yes stop_codon:yes gene_type:complete